MSVRFDNNTDFLSLAPTGTTMATLTCCMWVKRIVDTNGFATAYYVSNGAGGEIFLETETGGDIMWSYDLIGGGSTEKDLIGPSLTLNTWIFLCYVRTNTTQKLYWGTEAGGALNTATGTTTITNAVNMTAIRIGNDIYSEPFNGDIAYVRHWTVALTDLEVAAEYASATPVKTANLYGDWRLAAATGAGTDSSGGSHTMTINGTLANGTANPTPPSGSTSVTVTPAVVTGATSEKVPVILLSPVVQPAVVTAADSILTPTINTAAGASPSVVNLASSILTSQEISNHTATPAVKSFASSIITPSISSGSGGVTSSTPNIAIGSGYADVSMKQLVRTSGNILYTIAPTCDSYPDFSATGLTQTIRVHKGNTTGVPSSFTRKDSTHEPAAAVGCAAAIDGSDNIHIVWSARDTLTNTKYLRYAVFNTSTDLWGAVTTIASDLNYNDDGQGDENVSIAIDASGFEHVVYLTTVGGTKATRRCYYVTNMTGSWSSPFEVDSGTTYASNFKAWHPNIVFDTTGRVVVAWHVGTFNDTADGTVYVRTKETNGTWNTQVQVSASSGALTSIDGSTSMLITQDNVYHIVYVNASTTPGSKFIRYRYSTNNGGSWSANDPASGTQATHNPSLGLGANSKLRIYGHGTPDSGNHGNNLYYFEGLGQANTWGTWTLWETGTNWDCSINARWSQFFFTNQGYLDVIYWDQNYPNLLYAGVDVLGAAGSFTFAPNVITLASSVKDPTETGTANTQPSVVNLASSVKVPTETGTANVQPTVVTLSASVQVPTETGTSTTQPSVVSLASSVNATTETSTANVQPTAVSLVSSVKDPTETGNALVAPSALTGVFTENAIIVNTSGSTTVQPSVLGVSETVNPPSLNYDYKLTVTQLPLSGSENSPQVNLSSSVSPSSLSAAFSQQAVTITNTTTTVVTPSVTQLLASIQPTTQIGMGFALPSRVQLVSVLNDSLILGGAGVSPSVISDGFTVPPPTVVSTNQTIVTPSSLTLSGTENAPNLWYDSQFNVSPINMHSVLRFPTILARQFRRTFPVYARARRMRI